MTEPNLVELEHTCQSHRIHVLEYGTEEAILEMTFISMDRASRLIKSSFHLQKHVNSGASTRE